jgi:hypothetical protein
MVELREERIYYGFDAHSTEKTLCTMIDDPANNITINNVLLLAGGVGLDRLRGHDSEYLIPKNPPDTEVTALLSTVGRERLVNET